MLCWISNLSYTVNPARAGMILLSPHFVGARFGKPRASGDDPSTKHDKTAKWV